MTTHTLCQPDSALAAPPRAAEPTFIVGAVRSGTTLLRLMLDHHPQIAFHFEFEFAVDLIDAQGNLPDLAAYHRHLQQDRVFLLSGATIDPELGYVALVNSFLEQKRRRDGKQHVGATVHHRFDRLPQLWPQARYIHLLRDGRDVASSCIAMGWAGNMYCAVDRWIDAEQTWRRMQASLPADRVLDVRYEQLIAEPRVVLTDICQFLDVEFDDAMFNYVHTSSYGLPNGKLASQWRRQLPPGAIQLAEARIADMLVEREYPLSGLPRIDVGAAATRRLRRHDWRRRTQFRLRRYGLPLLAADFAARRTRFASLAQRCKRRMDAIDNLYLM